MLVVKCVPAVGGLSILETERKLVSPEVWTKLRAYFPKAPEFTQNQEPCQQCLVRGQPVPHFISSFLFIIFTSLSLIKIVTVKVEHTPEACVCV